MFARTSFIKGTVVKITNIIVAVAVLFVLLLAGCDAAQPYSDLEGVPVQDPDKAVILRNADLYPNLSVLCFESTAVITTTRQAAPVIVEDADLCLPGVLE